MSKIQWTDETWNPVVGCTKCSPGCDNCYAERMANRLGHMGQEKYQNVIYSPDSAFDKAGTWIGRAFCDEKSLEIPLHWRKPRQIFVCSMGDLFHKDVPEGFIIDVFDVAAKAAEMGHTLQFLTKRHQRMYEIVSEYCNWIKDESNIWLGVTVCNQKEADEKIPILLQTPAAVRFVSGEPLLEAIDFQPYCDDIDWFILGCESGPKRRPISLDDVYQTRCSIDSQSAIFIKQLNINGKLIKDINQFPEDLRIREYPK